MSSTFLIVFFLLGVSAWNLKSVSAHKTVNGGGGGAIGEQPLSKIALHKAVLALCESASVKAYPSLLGLKLTMSLESPIIARSSASLDDLWDFTKALDWYSTDFGMFHFCIADTEHDWRKGSEQYNFIEKCLASADRQKQPWLIFAAHRPLGYTSNEYYAQEGSFEEPMGRENLQRLWQRYKVDIAFYGHVHSYERSCPIYKNKCVNSETSHYSGIVNGTIHVVAGGGGSHLSAFSPVNTIWSLFKDYDFGFVKLTAFNHSSLLFEYKKSSDGKVYDSFTISRDYRDVLACVRDGCEPTK